MGDDESDHEFAEGPAGHVEHEPSRKDRRRFGGDDSFDDTGESDTGSCQACGAEIYADSPQCPVCGQYQGAAGTSSVPPWIVATALVVVLALVLGLALRGW